MLLMWRIGLVPAVTCSTLFGALLHISARIKEFECRCVARQAFCITFVGLGDMSLA